MIDEPAKPIHINVSALRSLLLTLVTGGLRMAGAALAARGFSGAETFDVDPAAQQIVGLLIAAGGQAWASWREQHKNSKIKAVFADENTLIPASTAVISETVK